MDPETRALVRALLEEERQPDPEAWAARLCTLPPGLAIRAGWLAAGEALASGSRDPWRRPEAVVVAVGAWLDDPSDENRRRCRGAAGATEEVWNDLAHHPQGPEIGLWACTTSLAWAVSDDQPGQSYSAVTGAIKAVGYDRVHRAVMEGLRRVSEESTGR